jgi:hypothetical protein
MRDDDRNCDPTISSNKPVNGTDWAAILVSLCGNVSLGPQKNYRVGAGQLSGDRGVSRLSHDDFCVLFCFVLFCFVFPVAAGIVVQWCSGAVVQWWGLSRCVDLGAI